MTHEEAVEALLSLDSDITSNKEDAYEILCEFLLSLGYKDVVDAANEVTGE